jgi:hypothetical protein
MPAHAVRDDGQPEIGLDDERVLVAGAPEATVGKGSDRETRQGLSRDRGRGEVCRAAKGRATIRGGAVS